MFSFTLLPNKVDATEDLLLPAIYVLHDTNYNSLLSLPSHFDGCNSFSVWVKPQNTKLAEGVYREQSPALFIKATHIGELVIAMGVLRFIPNMACNEDIKAQFTKARIKVMPEQDVELNLMETYQTRFLNKLNVNLQKSLCDLAMVAMSDSLTHCWLQFPESLTKQASYLLLDDGTRRGVWHRLGDLEFSPNMEFATIYYLDRQPDNLGLALHRLQINYKKQFKNTIEKQDVDSSNMLIREQNRAYLAGMMQDVFARKDKKSFEDSMTEIMQFCDVDTDVVLLDYKANCERVCLTILSKFIAENADVDKSKDFATAVTAAWNERLAALWHTPVVESMPEDLKPAMQEIPLLDEPDQPLPLVVNDNVIDQARYEADLAAARDALRLKFQREQEQANAKFIDSLFSSAPSSAASKVPKQSHHFSKAIDYVPIIKKHIIPHLSIRDVLNLTSTCQEFRSKLSIFNDPVLMLEMVKSMSPKSLYRFLQVKQKTIRELYADIKARKNVGGDVIIAIQILKALVMNVSEHEREGISFDKLIELRKYLVITRKCSESLIKSFDFMIDLLAQRAAHPFVLGALQTHRIGPIGINAAGVFILPLHNDKYDDEVGGFECWKYQPPIDGLVYYKNLRGVNLCSTDLENGNWDYACFDGANVKTAYFGKNKLTNTVFQFSASLFGMMIARKYFGLKLPTVKYFTDEPDRHEVYNVLSLFSNSQNWGMSYLFLSAIQPIARKYFIKKFTSTGTETFKASAEIGKELQGEVVNQLLAAVRRLVCKGKLEQALLVLDIAYKSDFLWHKRSGLKALKYHFTSKGPQDLIKQEYDNIMTTHKVQLSEAAKSEMLRVPELTIVDCDFSPPQHKNPFYTRM